MKVKSISISNKQILTQRYSGKSDKILPKKDINSNSNKQARPILTHREIEKKPEEPPKVSYQNYIFYSFLKYELPKDDEDEIEGDIIEL